MADRTAWVAGALVSIRGFKLSFRTFRGGSFFDVSPAEGPVLLLAEASCLVGLDPDIARGGGDTFRDADGSLMPSPRVP
jgi:hypothetical protein